MLVKAPMKVLIDMLGCWRTALCNLHHQGEYLVEDGRPLNIMGRTGLNGRGVLGK